MKQQKNIIWPRRIRWWTWVQKRRVGAPQTAQRPRRRTRRDTKDQD